MSEMRILAFGVTFEVPIVVILVVRMGVMSLDKLKEIRPPSHQVVQCMC